MAPKPYNGRLTRPVSLALQIRSSQRALGRWVTHMTTTSQQQATVIILPTDGTTRQAHLTGPTLTLDQFRTLDPALEAIWSAPHPARIRQLQSRLHLKGA